MPQTTAQGIDCRMTAKYAHASAPITAINSIATLPRRGLALNKSDISAELRLLGADRSETDYVRTGTAWKSDMIWRFQIWANVCIDRVRGEDFTQVKNTRSSTSVQCFFRASSRTRTQHRGTRTRSIPPKPNQIVGSTELTSTRSVSNWFFQSD